MKQQQIVKDLQRVASSSGLYAIANMLQRGLSFILLPVYTRFLDVAEYGILDMLSGLSAILFGLLLLGMPSALTKVFHRDCKTPEDQKAILWTALMLDLPPLLLGSGLLVFFAEPIGFWLLGEEGRADVIRLSVITVVFSSLVAIVLSSFRTREKAVAYALLNFLQFGLGMLLNVALVVWMRLGVEGVLWGNLVSSVVALPVGMMMARNDMVMRFERRLVPSLLHFGVLVIPTAMTAWVITMADRYVLRFYGSLEEVAIYGVGYKIGMILQMGLVWPFQLAWPAVAYSISKRKGHRRTFARVLTYLSFFMMIGILGLSLAARAGLDEFAGPSYDESYLVVPLVALAYAFAGVQFCLAPGVHIKGKTQYLTVFSAVGAILNLGLNFLLVPRYGMMGATWATTVSYAFLAAATAFLSQRVFWMPIETSRLVRIALGGGSIYAVGVLVVIDFQDSLVASLTWNLFLAVAAFPALMLASGFLRPGERRFIARLYYRLAPWMAGKEAPPLLGDPAEQPRADASADGWGTGPVDADDIRGGIADAAEAEAEAEAEADADADADGDGDDDEFDDDGDGDGANRPEPKAKDAEGGDGKSPTDEHDGERVTI